MSSARKRNGSLAAAVIVESGKETPDENSTAAPPQKYRVVGVKSTGKRTVLCAGICRDDAERWVASHKPFAIRAGGDVVLEVDSRFPREVAA